jgi:uncharacterized OsmC-like protein
MQTETANDQVVNGIDTAALKQTMDAVAADPSLGIVRFHTATRWQGGTRSETRVESYELGGQRHERKFTFATDEPTELLGTNTAPNPQEYLMSAMSSCIMATFVAASAMQGIELEHLEIESRGELDLRGFLGLDSKVKPGYDEIEYTIRVKGNGTKQQYEAVHEWVRKTSPNYFNMAEAIRLKPQLVIE